MQFNPIGDLASSFLLRKRGNALRTELSALTQEIASGRTRDVAGTSRENLAVISAIEHSIKLEDGFKTARQNVGQVLDFASLALSGISKIASDIGPSILASGTGAVGSDPIVAQTPGLLADVISYANTRHSGRYIFAGTQSDQPPIADVDTILADLTAQTSTATNAADFLASIDDWFSSPTSGFSTVAYQGGPGRSEKIDVSANQSVKFENTANDHVFRNTMKALATMALVDAGAYPGGDAEKEQILKAAAEGTISADLELISAQSKIGASQSSMTGAASQASVEVLMFETLRNDILSVDPFETATRLEEVQTQLESLYLVTARASRLSLSEYLR